MTGWRRIFIIAIIAIAGLVSGCFLFRDRILLWAFKKVQTHIHDSYKATLTARTVEFSGIDNVTLRNITLQPDGADTFLQISQARIKLSLTNLWQARLAPEQISITGGIFTIYNEVGRNNLSFLRHGRDAGPTDDLSATGYRNRAAKGIKRLTQLLNTAFIVHDIQINYEDSTGTESLYIPFVAYDLHHLSGILVNQKDADTITLSMRLLHRTGTMYECQVEHSGNDTAYLPFLDHEHSVRVRFHSLSARIDLSDQSDKYTIAADVRLEDFHIRHWRLANEDVVLPEATFKGKLIFTDDAIELDSSSVATMGSAPCRVFARYGLQPDTTFALAVHMPEVAADSFFGSLPTGMFNTLTGISCAGTLAYDLTFAIHTDDPDSLLFYSAMKQKELHIRHYGLVNYTCINGPFIYEAYDKDRFVRRITIGPDNPYFTPLTRLSPYLAQAVLQAEDPSFMQHRGFYLDAFRESIAKNYKERRFARGGSTLSMQLAKNVFLSHDKTVSRKAEEALVVYLIENLGLVSKERMLEVYLNVIEWGPNVYGIGEAAHFYFNKEPSQLTLQESLFLASIIPRPKSFRYQFNKEGHLRASMGDYFRILTTRMVWRGVLAPSDTIGLKPEVTLKGAAKHMVVPADTIPVESDETD